MKSLVSSEGPSGPTSPKHAAILGSAANAARNRRILDEASFSKTPPAWERFIRMVDLSTNCCTKPDWVSGIKA